jgi:allophanate hydrolase subunit 2
MPVGGVQIPPSGQPIVLLNGRGTIGGYPLIGTVVTPDVWRLGQAKPGDRIRFTRISVEDARSLTLDALQRLADATPSAQRQE